MNLQPQDVVVLVKLALNPGKTPTFAQLGHDLFLSPSQIHAAMQRTFSAQLLYPSQNGRRVNYRALKEFLVHGVKYAFPAERGEPARGVPTAYAGPPLAGMISQDNGPLPVWPYGDGTVRGYSFRPLYKNAPKAALQDIALYEMLALIDALRDGRARERDLAAKELVKRLDKVAA